MIMMLPNREHTPAVVTMESDGRPGADIRRWGAAYSGHNRAVGRPGYSTNVMVVIDLPRIFNIFGWHRDQKSQICQTGERRCLKSNTNHPCRISWSAFLREKNSGVS